VAVGSVLSAVPGRRRRPTDPVSTPVADTRLPGPGDAPRADPPSVRAVDEAAAPVVAAGDGPSDGGGGDRPVPAAVGADDDR
jgi:hypothetical protein